MDGVRECGAPAATLEAILQDNAVRLQRLDHRRPSSRNVPAWLAGEHDTLINRFVTATTTSYDTARFETNTGEDAGAR